MSIRSSCALVALLAVAVIAGRSEAAPERPVVGVYSLDSLPQSGRLTGFGAEGLQIQADGHSEPTNFALDSLREVRFPNGIRIPTVAYQRVTLTGGEVLVGQIRAPNDVGLQLEVAFVGRIDLAWESVQTIESVPADAGPKHDDADKYPPEDDGDVAHLTSDDLYRGMLVDADATHLVIETGSGARKRERKIPWDKLRVLHLANDPPEPPKGVQTELELVDGSRLHTATTPTLGDEGIAFQLRSAPEKTWTAPLSRIRVIRMKGGRFEYASDLAYTFERIPSYPESADESEYTKLYERFYTLRANRHPDGGPLQINDNVYRYGFATFGMCEISLKLDGKFKSFRSGVGIDDAVRNADGRERYASVDVRIYKDDSETPVFERKNVRHGQLVAVGPIDTTGVKTLRLVIGLGENSSTCDWVSWVDPVVVQE